MERANKEIEMLRKQYEAMSQELKEATQEAEVAKCRRDWAFQERDKIVAERESIRSVCVLVSYRLLTEYEGAYNVVDVGESLANICSSQYMPPFILTLSCQLFPFLPQDSVW